MIPNKRRVATLLRVATHIKRTIEAGVKFYPHKKQMWFSLSAHNVHPLT